MMAYFYHHFSDNYIDLPEKLEILRAMLTK